MANVGQGRYNAGAPPRLSDYAKEAKAKIDANFTKNFDGQKRREEVPVLPPNVTRDQFNAAIAELREKLGHEHVELNDKVCPLFVKCRYSYCVAFGRWVVPQSSQDT